jgi:hypothetical protein
MKGSAKILFWFPRILCILAIAFLSMFAMDSFSPDCTLWQNIMAFVIHLVPSFILIALLIVAWKWELIGGVIFTIIGLGISPFIYIHNFRMDQSAGKGLVAVLLVTMPFVIVGILFIVSHFMKNKQNKIS